MGAGQSKSGAVCSGEGSARTKSGLADVPVSPSGGPIGSAGFKSFESSELIITGVNVNIVDEPAGGVEIVAIGLKTEFDANPFTGKIRERKSRPGPIADTIKRFRDDDRLRTLLANLDLAEIPTVSGEPMVKSKLRFLIEAGNGKVGAEEGGIDKVGMGF